MRDWPTAFWNKLELVARKGEAKDKLIRVQQPCANTKDFFFFIYIISSSLRLNPTPRPAFGFVWQQPPNTLGKREWPILPDVKTPTHSNYTLYIHILTQNSDHFLYQSLPENAYSKFDCCCCCCGCCCSRSPPPPYGMRRLSCG